MWGWIIKVTMISLLLIFLLHYLYSFFKTTLTSPKLKDLVNKPQAKYNTIYNSLKSAGEVAGSHNLGEDNSNNANNIDNSKTANMKDELKKYLKELNIGSNNSNSNSGLPNAGVPNAGLPNAGVSNVVASNSGSNDNVSVYSPNNIMSTVGANGISTRVNSAPNYMSNINKVDTQTNIDYASPTVSSSYSSPYSPY